jgi:C-terminal processing protease CtpA/Prc
MPKRFQNYAALCRVLPFAALCASLIQPASAQKFDGFQRDRVLKMEDDVANSLRKHYYDPKYHGVDMEAHFKSARDAIRKSNNLGQAMAKIGQMLDDLNDSHTFFLPPPRATHREFGYVVKMIGDRCFVTDVRPHSDASEKIAPGDQILSWEGYAPDRTTLWKMKYAFDQLFAVPDHKLNIRHPDGTEAEVDVQPKVRQGKRILDITSGDDYWQLVREEENSEHLDRQRVIEFGDSLMVWKMPEFDLAEDDVDHLMSQARHYQFLAIDLRGNPGGAVKTLEWLVGRVMGKEVTIADRKGRKSNLKPIMAKPHGSIFQGKLIVLVDSGSASAAELFARAVQLEHRGTVLGDRSSGSVMESVHYSFSQGANTAIFYGVSVTDADLTMKDGKSLEHAGVVPDESILPTAEDLAQGRDPVLARAAQLAGVKLDAVQAGKLFPYEWRPE